jgi:hypothetical protein
MKTIVQILPCHLIKRFPLYFTLPAIMIVMLLSCEEVMDVSFSGDKTKNLVVEGTITTDTMAHKVILSYSGDYFNTAEQDMVSDAEVSISDGDTTFLLQEESPGIYLTDTNVYGITGKTYTLNIKLKDNREFTASEYLRPCANIDSITQSYNYNYFGSGYGYDVLFYAQEPEPIGDCYLFLLYLDNVLYSDTITEVSFVDDEFVNGNYINDLIVYRINEVDIPDSVDVTLEIYSLTRQYYDFMYALMLETVWKGSPWDGPPADLPGNISNGGLGYFRASDIKRKSTIFFPRPRIN